MQEQRVIQKNDEIINHFKFIFEKGEHEGEAYEVLMEVDCKNPVCTCGDVWFFVRSISSKTEMNYSFLLDIENKEISKNIINKLSLIELNFARSFIADLKDQNWQDFYRYFYSYKSELTKNIDNFDDLKIDFPLEDIEYAGLMIGYSDIFPFGKNFSFFYKEKNYVIEDQYCLDIQCNCTHSLLILIEINGQKAIDEGFSPAFFLNYKNKKWEIENNPFNNSDIMDAMVAELIKSIPNIFDIIKQRHKILKRLYKNFKDERFPDIDKGEQRSKNKIGRNDPCPCGSGKKYKKCCGS